MIRAALRGVVLGVLAIALFVIVLVTPVIYVETACKSDSTETPRTALLDPAHHRSEARTLMTYPEWHIVHAYEAYGAVISKGDPHDFNFFQEIVGFWSKTCRLTQASAALGGVDGATRQMVYVIGMSFTAELLAKAAYEETLGRVATLLRGPERSPLDDLSAEQARAYAAFLQQVPWYQWDFDADQAALVPSANLRDRERAIALGLEYGTKARYARIIAAAVAATGQDDVTLRMIVSGPSEDMFTQKDGVRLIERRSERLEIEVPRYRQLTLYLVEWADQGANFIEIAGNDDILLTALGAPQPGPDVLDIGPRQGFDDHRHLIFLKVGDLASRLRRLDEDELRLEHIHDY